MNYREMEDYLDRLENLLREVKALATEPEPEGAAVTTTREEKDNEIS